MKELYFTIDDEIFRRFPGYMRGVVVAHGVRNGPSPLALIEALRAAEVTLRGKLNIDELSEQPRLKSWREAYRLFGAKPSEFRSSIEALARRVLHDNPLPTINALVDMGTVVSLDHLLPVGGHAIDVLRNDIALRFASGRESFVAFGSREVEHPLPGEVVFVEGDQVLTRRWTWRQANHTLIDFDSQAVEVNVDGLPPVGPTEVEQACKELMELIGTYCGGAMRYGLLTQDAPRILLTTIPQ